MSSSCRGVPTNSLHHDRDDHKSPVGSICGDAPLLPQVHATPCSGAEARRRATPRCHASLRRAPGVLPQKPVHKASAATGAPFHPCLAVVPPRSAPAVSPSWEKPLARAELALFRRNAFTVTCSFPARCVPPPRMPQRARLRLRRATSPQVVPWQSPATAANAISPCVGPGRVAVLGEALGARRIGFVSHGRTPCKKCANPTRRAT